VPGFVDLHVHGGGGGSFTDGEPDSAVQAVLAHRAHGTTTTLASLVAAGPEELLRSVRMLAELQQSGMIAGVHLEGPWLSPQHRGAHDSGSLRPPESAELARLLATGTVAMVTLAPELPGGIKAIRQIVDAGAIAAIGHTNATYDQTVAAIEAGARLGTHLFNAMRPPHQREPGPVAALLEDHRVSVELIADGVHVHPAWYRMVTRLAGDRTVLVTDAMAAAGLGDGGYRLGAQQVTVTEGIARVAGTTTIAGSTATAEDLFRRAIANGNPPSPAPDLSDDALLRAVQQTSVTPARVLGRRDLGGLRPGIRADLLVLTSDLRIHEVIRA